MGKKTKHPAPPAAVRSLWMVAREYEGLAGAGGVKDVVRQLAESLAQGGMQVTVVLPCYGFIDPAAQGFSPLVVQEGAGDVGSFPVDMHYVDQERRESVSIWEQSLNRVRVFLVASPRFAEKRGIYTYTALDEKQNPARRQGSGHYDYFSVNVLLQKAALELLLLLDERPDILHCHDGHTALLPAMARELPGFRQFFRKTGMVVTIHNAGMGYHQETHDLAFARAVTGLPEDVILKHQLDRRFDPLLAAASYAVLNTVSENYARELQETEADEFTGWLGHHLKKEGVTLHGITNGVNPAAYDPSRPEALGLAAAYSPLTGDLAGKKTCRRRLLTAIEADRVPGTRCHGRIAPDDPRPLFTFIGRLAEQKGVDVLCLAMAKILRQEDSAVFLVMGEGARQQTDRLLELAMEKDFSGRIAVLVGYDRVTANQVFAAGDFFLVPSRFEPCGLTDLIAQLFGAVPVVHGVGGLVKVRDGDTGLVFQHLSPETLAAAIRRAVELFGQPAGYQRMQQQAARRVWQEYSWDKVRGRYRHLYEKALPSPDGGTRLL